ncbi:flagellar hook-basal body protein [Paenibacillus hunanensis]|uniref:flagellar hook-basal body protein n=1 Tax=Paenibacillus hunanensis TaxID=539262 RepID=UPI002026F8BA|nr:flagellar hook-basal body protein [Paenibacillus hunanensis]MCL9661835.1 flagellar hook-basal body protein [Paenibacillus hunanensis]
MLRGLYTAASGMITQQRRHDTVTQNIANINTPGYKQVDSIERAFPDMLLSLSNGDEGMTNRQIGRINTGVLAEESVSMNVQGDVHPTDSADDFAIVSEINLADPATGQNIPFDPSGKYVAPNGTVTYRPQAFFTVTGKDGNTGYTRDGNFHLNGAGNLLTTTGNPVLGTNGNPITLQGSMEDYNVDSRGIITAKATGGEVGRIGITVVNQPGLMTRTGDGLFTVNNPATAGVRQLQAGDNVELRQGYLEGSTVDAAASMVELNAALRAYESNQKVIQFYDKSLDKAVNEVGRV